MTLAVQELQPPPAGPFPRAGAQNNPRRRIHLPSPESGRSGGCVYCNNACIQPESEKAALIHCGPACSARPRLEAVRRPEIHRVFPGFTNTLCSAGGIGKKIFRGPGGSSIVAWQSEPGRIACPSRYGRDRGFSRRITFPGNRLQSAATATLGRASTAATISRPSRMPLRGPAKGAWKSQPHAISGAAG